MGVRRSMIRRVTVARIKADGSLREPCIWRTSMSEFFPISEMSTDCAMTGCLVFGCIIIEDLLRTDRAAHKAAVMLSTVYSNARVLHRRYFSAERRIREAIQSRRIAGAIEEQRN